MKLKIKVQPQDDTKGIEVQVDVPIPEKHLRILKESGRLAFAITEAIKNIKAELKGEDTESED